MGCLVLTICRNNQCLRIYCSVCNRKTVAPKPFGGSKSIIKKFIGYDSSKQIPKKYFYAGRVCSKHFLPSDYCNTGCWDRSKMRKLKPDAVPTPCFENKLNLHCSVILERMDFDQLEVKLEEKADDWTGWINLRNDHVTRNKKLHQQVLDVLYGGSHCCICLCRVPPTGVGDMSAGCSGDLLLELGRSAGAAPVALRDMLRTVLPHQLDKLPVTYLCKNCTDSTITAYIFIQKAKNAAETLTRYLSDIEEQVNETLGRINEGCSMKNVILSIPSRCRDSIIPIDEKEDKPKTDMVNELDYQSDDSFKWEEDDPHHGEDKERSAAPRVCPECPRPAPAHCPHARYLRWLAARRGGPPALRLACPDCAYRAPDPRRLLEHAALRHVREPLWPCSKCHRAFFTSTGLRSHYQRCVTKLFICAHCDREFHRKPEFVGHVNLCKDVVRPLGCDSCVATFDDEAEVSAHRDERHGSVDRRSRLLVTVSDHDCKICLKKFISRKSLLKHKKKCKAPRPERGRKKQVCPVCAKEVFHLNRHMESHRSSGKASHLCETCGEKCKTAKSLKRHLEHTHVRPFVTCTICGKNIKSSNILNHQRKHRQNCQELRLEVKKLKCAECDYSSAREDYMENHVNRYHKKVRPYSCKVCSKSFTSAELLGYHSKTHAAERPRLQCALCPASYLSRAGLISHTRLAHTGERPFRCERCGAAFAMRSILTRHAYEHDAAREHCPLCTKSVGGWVALRQHLKKVHWKLEGTFDPARLPGLSAADVERFSDRRSSSYRGPDKRFRLRETYVSSRSATES